VTLLYQLKSLATRADSSVTTRDILKSDSIEELCKLLKGEPVIRRKRIRDQNNEEYNETKMSRMTCSKKVERVKHGHVTVQLRACVDSSVLVAANGTDIYGACQGGVIQKLQNLGTTFDVAAQCTLDELWATPAWSSAGILGTKTGALLLPCHWISPVSIGLGMSRAKENLPLSRWVDYCTSWLVQSCM
jgi:hypothetical protein